MSGADKNRRRKKKEEKKKQEEPPPTSEMLMQDHETYLYELYQKLAEFYEKHKKENVTEDVLTIMLQFVEDKGGVEHLNKKLKKKYGEDLDTFKNTEQKYVMPVQIDDTLKRQSQSKAFQKEYGIDLPPSMAPETLTTSASASIRKSFNKANAERKSRSRTGANLDPALIKYKETIGTKDPNEDAHQNSKSKEEDPKLKLSVLDQPSSDPLKPKDLIEAFYSKHDETKLDSEAGIEKFVKWVDTHSLAELSTKLRAKYDEGLTDVELLARRRKNLEEKLTGFYLKHDRAKLETRWTILKILGWTMSHGLVELNRKFRARYGDDVCHIENEDLDI